MGFQENRYLVDCLNSLDDMFLAENRSLSDLNIIEGGLIVLGTLDATLKHSKKRNFSISKQPSTDLKFTTLKNTIFQFNNYMQSKTDFSIEELLDNIKNISYEINETEQLTKYIPPSKIDKTNNLFVYFKNSLFEDDKLKDNLYVKWFLEDMPISGNLRIGEELDRVLAIKGLNNKKQSKAYRQKILCAEYDYLVLQTREVKNDFDLRYDLNNSKK